jgi:hypothetical protein
MTPLGTRNEELMCNPAARIEFLAPTHDDQGQMIHHPGETITGELLARNNDFLLVRADTGTWMYLDVTRTDLYQIDVQDGA